MGLLTGDLDLILPLLPLRLGIVLLDRSLERDLVLDLDLLLSLLTVLLAGFLLLSMSLGLTSMMDSLLLLISLARLVTVSLAGVEEDGAS